MGIFSHLYNYTGIQKRLSTATATATSATTTTTAAAAAAADAADDDDGDNDKFHYVGNSIFSTRIYAIISK